MKKIFFVLKDEDLFQVWIKQAAQLNFTSMDERSSKEANIRKQPNADSSNASKPVDSDDDRHRNRRETPRAVTDLSKRDEPGKPVVDQDQPNDKQDTDQKARDDKAQTEDEKNKNVEKRYAIYTAESMIFVVFLK